MLATTVTGQEVQYIAEGKKVKKVTKDDFLSNFERIVLQAEPDEKSGEKDFWVNRRKEIVRTNKTDGYEDIGIEIGNHDAENIIIKVCNPYCGSCAKAQPVIEEIINNNKNVKMKLIFTASNDKDGTRGIVARHLLANVEKPDGLLTQQALEDWYLADKKDYELFAKKYQLNGEIKQQEAAIEKMKACCKEAQIMRTPTFFINGKRLPETYRIDELKYIL